MNCPRKTKFLISAGHFIFLMAVALVSILFINFQFDFLPKPKSLSMFLLIFLGVEFIARRSQELPNISIGNLELFSFCIFILGRFWVALLDANYTPFCLDYFRIYCSSGNQNMVLFSWLLLHLAGREAGYLYCIKRRKPVFRRNFCPNTPDIVSTAFILFLLFMAVILAMTYISQAISSRSYMALYLAQGENYSVPSFLFLSTTLTGIALGLSTRFANTTLFRIGLVLYGLISLAMLYIGGRSGFFSFAIFIIFLHFRITQRDWSLKKIFFTFSALGLFIHWAMTFTFRGGETQLSAYDIVFKSLDSQGISLMVFDLTTRINSFPPIIYLKYIIPTVLLKFSIDSDFPTYLSSFGHYLAYISDKSLYMAGYGLGWTLIGDIFLFSARNPFVFFILSFLYGGMLRKLDRNSSKSSFIYGFGIALFPTIIMLPRMSVSTFIQLGIFYTLCYLGVLFVKKNLISSSVL